MAEQGRPCKVQMRVKLQQRGAGARPKNQDHRDLLLQQKLLIHKSLLRVVLGTARVQQEIRARTSWRDLESAAEVVPITGGSHTRGRV